MFKIKFCNFEYGRKITGGYSITIESVVETDKNIIINVKESVPAPNSMVTQGYYLSVLCCQN
jgi:hypothetical protein